MFKILLIICITALPFTVNAADIVMDFTGGQGANDNRDYTMGWSFTVNTEISVDGLGLWDEDADGLSQGYLVNLWDNRQFVIASTTVDNTGTAIASTSDRGQWIFQDISAVLLTPGEYTIGFYRPGSPDATIDNWIINTLPSTISEITFGDQREIRVWDDMIHYPSQITGDSDGHFGPNLRVAAVPIPAAVWLFGSGLIGLIALARRKT